MAKKQFASRRQLVDLLTHCLVTGNFVPMSIMADRFDKNMVVFGKSRGDHHWEFPVRGGTYRLTAATGVFTHRDIKGRVAKFVDPVQALYWIELGYNAPTINDLKANAEALAVPEA